MELKHYSEIEPKQYTAQNSGGLAEGVAGRVVVGKKDGAENFCMRVFEIAPGGHSPKHAHNWEHEMFFHAGEGEVFGKDGWRPVRAGCAVFMPANEEHQVRNTGTGPLIFICLIPSTAPEL